MADDLGQDQQALVVQRLGDIAKAINNQTVTAGSGAPVGAEYLVGAADSTLTDERVVTDTTSNTWDLATSGQAKVKRAALTGDVTASADSNATAIAANAVTDTKFRQSTALSVVGRSANSTGNVADISASTNADILGRLSNALGFSSVSAFLDAAFSSTQGAVLYRGASAWAALGTGTSGYFLQTQGAAANPQWALPTAGLSAASQSDMETATSNTVASTPGVQQYHPGHPKCWAYITVSGGTPTLSASYNITSITDTGTGICTVTINNDFSSSTWAPFITIRSNVTATNQAAIATCNTIAAGSIVLQCVDIAAATARDPDAWSFVGFGDL